MKSHDERRIGGHAGAAGTARTAGTAGTGESRCAHCGAPFHCGITDPGGCWCAKLPPLPREAYAADAGCLCEGCLRRAVAAAQAAGGSRG